MDETVNIGGFCACYSQRLLNEGQVALARVERNTNQLQLEFSRKQEAIETLRGKIEDDFGLVMFEYAADVSGPVPLPFEGMVEELPVVTQVSPELESQLVQNRTHLRRMGPINPEAKQEFDRESERYTFMKTQDEDLQKAEEDLKHVIAELDELTKQEFSKTFDAVDKQFRAMFTRLFGGGSARLALTDPDNLVETGIEIEAMVIALQGGPRHPGKKIAYEEEALREECKHLNLQLKDSISGVAGIERMMDAEILRPWSVLKKFNYRGSVHDLNFASPLGKTAEMEAIIQSLCLSNRYDCSDLGGYLLPVERGRAVHCEFDLHCDCTRSSEAEQVRNIWLKASEALINRGAYFSRPYGPWADMMYRRSGNYTLRQLQARIADLEGRITEREQEIATLEADRSQPGFYEDLEKSKTEVDRHQALMWEVGDLMGQREALQAHATEQNRQG